MIGTMTETLLHYELRRPVVEELKRSTPLVAAVIGLAVVKWVRADGVARGYADFLGSESPELPPDYWWSVWFLLFAWVAIPVVLLVIRARRQPMLTIDAERIEASYSNSSVRRIDTPRVSEIQLTNRGLRFFARDGLAPRVPSRLLVGVTDVHAALEIGGRLNVPVYRVTGPVWRRHRERLDAAATPTGSG
jgi:hypothetical protein